MLKRVLLVDPDLLARRALETELGSKSLAIHASSADMALQLLSKMTGIQAIVTDHLVTVGDRRLLEDVRDRHDACARVLVSGSVSPREAARLLAAGVAHVFVAKPWRRGEILAAVVKATALATPSTTAPVRSAPRVEARVQLEVASQAWTGFKPLWTRDVAPGGAFFQHTGTDWPPPSSNIWVKLPSRTVDGRVAHVEDERVAAAFARPAGFGVAFERPQTAQWWVEATGLTSTSVEAPAPRAPPSAANPEAGRNFFSLGLELFRAQAYAGARQKFELAARVSNQPEFVAMQLVCNGIQFARLDMWDKARDAFRRALRIAPTCAEAKAGLDDLETRAAKARG